MDSKKDCKICSEGNSLSGGSCKYDPQSLSFDTTPSSVGDSSTGGIIGAVVGVIVLIALIAIVSIVVVVRRRQFSSAAGGSAQLSTCNSSISLIPGGTYAN